jgi:hypothetical protein
MAWYERGSERSIACIPVSIGPIGMLPVAGTVINISRGGAAISIEGWNMGAPVDWLLLLRADDEMRMTGLHKTPTSCRMVAFANDVLRVRFS